MVLHFIYDGFILLYGTDLVYTWADLDAIVVFVCVLEFLSGLLSPVVTIDVPIC